MKIEIWSVGKPHDEYVKAGIEDFTKRINKYFNCSWKIIPAPKNAATLTEIALKKAEATLILASIAKDDYVVLLDERGKQPSSTELAAFLQLKANDSIKKIIFVIGGAFGVDASVQQRANYMLSLSNLVFPHMLVRLIIAEQLYRACTILHNEKYHHA